MAQETMLGSGSAEDGDTHHVRDGVEYADLVPRLTRFRPKRTSSRALQAVTDVAGPSSAPDKRQGSMYYRNDPASNLIWVDSKDPVNGKAFQPHHLKPIPPFMARRITKTTSQ